MDNNQKDTFHQPGDIVYEQEAMPVYRSKSKPEGLIRFNKPLIIGILLVIFCLCVYTMNFRSSTKQLAVDKQHAAWLEKMKDSLNKGSNSQDNQLREEMEQTRVSMTLSVDGELNQIPKEEMPERYIPEIEFEKQQEAEKMISMRLPNLQLFTDKPAAEVKPDEVENYDDEKDLQDSGNRSDNNDVENQYDNTEYNYGDKSAGNYEENEDGNDEVWVSPAVQTIRMSLIGIQQDSYQPLQNMNLDQGEQNELNQPMAQTAEQIRDNNIGPYAMVPDDEQNAVVPKREQNMEQDARQSVVQTAGQQYEVMEQNIENALEQNADEGMFQNPQQQFGQNFEQNVEQVVEQNAESGLQQIKEQQVIENPIMQNTQVINEKTELEMPQDSFYNDHQADEERVQPNVNGNIEKTTTRDTIQLTLRAANFVNNGPPLNNIDQVLIIQNPEPQMEVEKLKLSDAEINPQHPYANPQNENPGDAVQQAPMYNQNNLVNVNLQSSLGEVQNDAVQLNQDKPLTLPALIESRINLQKEMKDMTDIKFGSQASDDDNKMGWQWNAEEKINQTNGENNIKDGKLATLVKQVHKHTETEPLAASGVEQDPYKLKIDYPDYLTPVVWKTTVGNASSVECLPFSNLDISIKVCIHSQDIKSDASVAIKAGESWEYNTIRDMQIALSEHKDSILIDVGASIGIFSLAAAANNRNVIAIEPYSSNIDVFQQSVLLNAFEDKITLFQAVVSDRRGKVWIKPLEDNADNVYIQTVEDNEQSTNYSLVLNSFTLDDIERVCPTRIAVLKIDVPGFTKKVLTYSHYFFKYIYVTHVLMHWDISDRDLCQYLVRFFVERNYLPFSDLQNANSNLNIEEAETWTHTRVIWKMIH